MFSPPAALRRLHPVAESNRVALSTRSPPTPPLAGEVWQALHWFSLKAGPSPSAGPNTWLNNAAPARNRASSARPRPGSGVPGLPQVPADRPQGIARPARVHGVQARVVVVVVDDLHEHAVGRLGGGGLPDVGRPAVGAGCREHDYRSAAEPWKPGRAGSPASVRRDGDTGSRPNELERH